MDSTTPENVQLQLPSAFNAALRQTLGLTELATIEYELREGQAHDALKSLRQIIQEFNHNLLDKKNNVHGITATLHSELFLRVFTSDKQIAAATYRRARNAMISLGLSSTDSLWRELHDDQLWGRMSAQSAAWVTVKPVTRGFGKLLPLEDCPKKRKKSGVWTVSQQFVIKLFTLINWMLLSGSCEVVPGSRRS